MRRPAAHRDAGIFVAEGEQVIQRLLRTDLEVLSLLMPERWAAAFEPLLTGRPNVPLFVAPKALLETLTGYQFYQGILATARVPSPPPLAKFISGPPAPRAFLAMDGIGNSDNMGTLIRTAAALGVHGVLVSDTSCSPFLRRAVRTSMGAVWSLPIIEALPLPRTLQELRQSGIRVIAAHPTGAKSLGPAIDLARDVCIVLGSEGPGISPEVLAVADEHVGIDMTAALDSLNVSAAGAIFLYELRRQRSARAGTDPGSAGP